MYDHTYILPSSLIMTETNLELVTAQWQNSRKCSNVLRDPNTQQLLSCQPSGQWQWSPGRDGDHIPHFNHIDTHFIVNGYFSMLVVSVQCFWRPQLKIED